METGIFYAPSLTSSDSSFGIDKEDIKVRVVNLDLLGILKYTFNNGIALFAKGGAAYTNQHLNISESVTIYNSTATQTLDTSGHKFAPEAALGIGYQFNPNLEMDLTANTVFAGNGSQNNPAATNSALMLGLTYHFA